MRNLLDLIIARIPGLNSREKVFLCKEFSRESDFDGCSWLDIKNKCIDSLSKPDGSDGENQMELFSETAKSFSIIPSKTPSKTPQKRRLRNLNASIDIQKCKAEAYKDALYMQKMGIKYVSIVDDSYPCLLKEIFDPPAVLFYRGDLKGIKGIQIAIVGTRHAKSESLSLCYKIARGVSEEGFTVVSGLALGVDAMAHRGCIDGKSPTIAVLGSSVDCIAPLTNKPLARRIIEGGGAIVSEYPPLTQPTKWSFPERNRIISGLCPFTLVIEAGVKSGALITVDFALSEGRDLGVALDSSGNPCGEGCKKLASEGAKQISSASDILKEFAISPCPKNDERRKTDEQSKDVKSDLASSLAAELGM
ncbi:MAG: hypothetical protein Ta2G_09040 [Termitinemataceae bacterium]|nr:MAG: hypothetical protein Ta2G_09040 [Termitinemataceae bacterium]